SCREVERRLKRLELSITKIRAIFITHEHSDHIKGVEVLSRKHQIPVYITTTTLLYSKLQLEKQLTFSFRAYEAIQIEALSILAFPKFHDAADPHSFIIESNGIKIGVLTDIGSNCKHVIDNFKQCHAAFLEANYDERMLDEGGYPYHLKRRIRGDKGHLSNDQALELFLKHKPKFMSHVFLSHLSKNNNCPKLVHQLFLKHAGNTTTMVASRDEESAVYEIRNNDTSELMRKKSEEREMLLSKQMKMF
ncbi:MAG TPA: MBL fold metallo-hydrolase, partial [Bacteroidia bacterium]|nr:MBL fold metallo-hydrolase [Bacteroidia bacterium]